MENNSNLPSSSSSSHPPPPSTPDFNQNPLPLLGTDEMSMPQSFLSFFSGGWIDNVVLELEQSPKRIGSSLAAEIRENNEIDQNSLIMDHSDVVNSNNYMDYLSSMGLGTGLGFEPEFPNYSYSSEDQWIENNLLDHFIHMNNTAPKEVIPFSGQYYSHSNFQTTQFCSHSIDGYTGLLSDVVSATTKPVAPVTESSQPSLRPRLSNGALAATNGRANSLDVKKNPKTWSIDEHKLFLVGMNIYGQGDWKNIANNVVITKTHTQVASHAQKYFLRQSSSGQKRKRSSIHDITTVDPKLLSQVLARLTTTTIDVINTS